MPIISLEKFLEFYMMGDARYFNSNFPLMGTSKESSLNILENGAEYLA